MASAETNAAAGRPQWAQTPSRASPGPDPARAREQLASSVRRLGHVALEAAAGWAGAKVEQGASKLDDFAAQGSVGTQAALGAARAALQGKSPLWAAIKAAVFGLGRLGTFVMIVGLILAPVLLLVLLVLLVLALLVVAIVAAFRAATRQA